MNAEFASGLIGRYLARALMFGSLVLFGATGCDTGTPEWEPRVEPVMPETSPEIEPAERVEPAEQQDTAPVFEFD